MIRLLVFAMLSLIVTAQISQSHTQVRATLEELQTVEAVGAAQGLELRDGKLYIIGDAEVGVLREYTIENNRALKFTGRAARLTVGGQDKLAHPTGLTFHPQFGTWLGNTVNRKGNIVLLNWEKLLQQGTLDGAIKHEVADDAAVNGTRPEFVQLGSKWFLASSDYGDQGNQIRLYDPQRLAKAQKTSEPGVLVHKFSCGAWVQSLHWIAEKGWLVLVQNQIEGLKWRLTFVDLKKSVANGKAEVVHAIDFAPQDELEGFHMISKKRGMLISSSRARNVAFVEFGW